LLAGMFFSDAQCAAAARTAKFDGHWLAFMVVHSQCEAGFRVVGGQPPLIHAFLPAWLP
jgi:hypothetical protein